MSLPYAGDLIPQEAWDMLKTSENCQLIDVRTEAEWAWVGLADLSSLNKKPHLVEWNHFPGGETNGNFMDQVAQMIPDRTTVLVILCRSGVRSRNAAIALTSIGYQTCYNVAQGFEGDPDTNRHRGTVNGWKVAGLPWAQG